MKITSYKCDRCGAALGEDGVALVVCDPPYDEACQKYEEVEK